MGILIYTSSYIPFHRYVYLNIGYVYVYDYMTAMEMKVKFVSTVSKMGDKYIINVPSAFNREAEKLHKKQIRVNIDDEI